MGEKRESYTNKILIIIIILLCLLVGGLIGYIVCDNIVNGSNSSDSEVKENNKVEEEKSDDIDELSLEDEFVQKMFKTHDYFVLDSVFEEFYDSDRLLISNLSKDTKKYMFVWRYLTRLEPDKIDNSGRHYYSDTVSREWKGLFGSNVNYPFTSQDGSGFTDDGSYIGCDGCGADEGFTKSTNILLRATKNKDEIVLYEGVKFIEWDPYELTPTYYTDYNKTIKTTEDEKIPANYKFIYKYDKEIDNYYFHSVEKIK